MDATSRKHATLSRLRQQLKKKQESLADQFDFKIYVIFKFKKEQKKPCAVFEVTEIVSVMTNNYEDTILQGAKENAYSYASSRELLEQDIVQLHAPKWHSMRKDLLGSESAVDFMLWPRTDIESTQCLLFSRWKGSGEPFRPLLAEYAFEHSDCEQQLTRLVDKTDKRGQILTNTEQNMFFFTDRKQLQTVKNQMVVWKLINICLYLPQDQLMCWGPKTCAEMLKPYLPD